MEIYLIRHTRPDIEYGICYGQSDIDVASTFKDDARAVKAKLEDVPCDLCFCSPLQRCVKLAHRLVSASDISFSTRLKEMNFGEWEMQPWNTIDQGELNSWMEHFTDTAPPGGESMNQVMERSRHFWNRLMEKEFDSVFLVTHGGIIRCMIAHILDLPVEKAVKFDVDYGSVTRIQVHLQHQWAQIKYINR